MISQFQVPNLGDSINAANQGRFKSQFIINLIMLFRGTGRRSSSRDKFKIEKENARKERLKQNMKVECCEKK